MWFMGAEISSLKTGRRVVKTWRYYDRFHSDSIRTWSEILFFNSKTTSKKMTEFSMDFQNMNQKVEFQRPTKSDCSKFSFHFHQMISLFVLISLDLNIGYNHVDMKERKSYSFLIPSDYSAYIISSEKINEEFQVTLKNEAKKSIQRRFRK
jgi:hypothetical protein